MRGPGHSSESDKRYSFTNVKYHQSLSTLSMFGLRIHCGVDFLNFLILCLILLLLQRCCKPSVSDNVDRICAIFAVQRES
jgi:hypothetical protein